MASAAAPGDMTDVRNWPPLEWAPPIEGFGFGQHDGEIAVYTKFEPLQHVTVKDANDLGTAMAMLQRSVFHRLATAATEMPNV